MDQSASLFRSKVNLVLNTKAEAGLNVEIVITQWKGSRPGDWALKTS